MLTVSVDSRGIRVQQVYQERGHSLSYGEFVYVDAAVEFDKLIVDLQAARQKLAANKRAEANHLLSEAALLSPEAA